MGLRRKYRNSLVRLASSFILVLVLLAVIVGYAFYTASVVSRLHGYKMAYVVARDELLLRFHHEFAYLSSYGHYSDDAHFFLANLETLANDFYALLGDDPRLMDTNLLEKTVIKGQVMYYAGAAFRSGEFSYEHFAIAQGKLSELRTLSYETRVNTLSYIDSRAASMQRNFYVLLAAFGFLFVLLVYLSVKMVANLMGGARLYREKVQLVNEKDAVRQTETVSDISDMITDITNSISSLVADIDKVADENRKGNARARINTAQLYGIYVVAANAINSLLDIIDKEREINETKQLMFDAAPVVMTVFNRNLDIYDCSEEGLRRYGFKSKEDYAKNFFDASPKYQPDGTLSVEKGRELMLKCFDVGYTHFEWMHQSIDGKPIPSDVICFPMKYNDEDVMLAYAIDISELKKSIELAREADERTKLMVDLEKERVKAAEENSRTKSRFLARMSHEIRTPIAAVLGISEIQLRNPNLTAELDEALAKIHNSAAILLGIVNDVLDLSKIEAGKMSINNEKYEIANMIGDVVQLNLAFMGSKKIDFVVNVDEKLPRSLIGDELRLKQVLNNLLSNAFKYTDTGIVKLIFEGVGAVEDDEVSLRVIISDTGSGMTSEQLAALFDEYARFTEDGTSVQAGTGLGMPITKSLISLMGGKLDVSSSYGVGTRVELNLKQKRASDEPIGQVAVKNIQEFKVDTTRLKKKLSFIPEPMPYGRILVVDDVETNLYVAKGLMQIYGLQIETCESGYGAIEKIKAGNTYDIIFMDHMMPGMDGVETTAEIRRLGYKEPIIALTANALIGQAEEYVQRGFDAFISKPIQATPLDAALNRYVKDRHMEVEHTEDLGIDLSGFDDEPEEFVASEEMMEAIRADFLESGSDAYEKTKQYIKEGDFKTAYRHAHNLKNLAALLNDKALVKASEACEKDLAAENVDEARLHELGVELERVLHEID